MFSIDRKGSGVGLMVRDGSCLLLSAGRMAGATLLFLGSLLLDVLHAFAVLVGGLSLLLDRSCLCISRTPVLLRVESVFVLLN